MMELKLPKPLIHWIDEVRGKMSREAYIVHNMVNLMNQDKIDESKTNLDVEQPM